MSTKIQDKGFYEKSFPYGVWEGVSKDTVLAVMLKHQELFDYRFENKDLSGAHEIIDATCELFGLDKEVLFSRSRRRDIIYPRQIVQTMLRTHTRLSLATIGEWTSLKGSKSFDHATVMNSITTICDLIEVNPDTATTVNRIRGLIGFPTVRNEKALSKIYRKSHYRNGNKK